jgi:GMP synthase (glutamine-hydrolysing)
MAHGPLLIVVTGEPPDSVRERHGDYPAMIARALGESWPHAFAAADARLPGALGDHDVSAIVITGSSASVHAREPWMIDSERWLAERVAAGVPILGICFGHQLLAQALGGEVTPNPCGREMSTVAVERVADSPLFLGVPPVFDANACHRDTVYRLPEGAEVLAQNGHDQHQALRFAARCYGVQFHPEFDGSIMRGYVDAREPLLVEEGLDPRALGERALDAPFARRVLANFGVLARGELAHAHSASSEV